MKDASAGPLGAMNPFETLQALGTMLGQGSQAFAQLWL